MTKQSMKGIFASSRGSNAGAVVGRPLSEREASLQFLREYRRNRISKMRLTNHYSDVAAYTSFLAKIDLPPFWGTTRGRVIDAASNTLDWPLQRALPPLQSGSKRPLQPIRAQALKASHLRSDLFQPRAYA